MFVVYLLFAGPPRTGIVFLSDINAGVGRLGPSECVWMVPLASYADAANA
jgi:hypothetical protein